MSFNYRTYVGPYVRCAVEQVPATQLQTTCLNSSCANHGKGQRTPFCSLCGGKVGTVPHTVLKDAVDDGAIQEQIDEHLVTASGDDYWRWTQAEHAHIWLSNVGTNGRDYHLEERDPWMLAEITSAQIDQEMVAFLLQFQDEINALQNAYGSDAVKMHWGIIQDYS